ncbi:MAG: SDR family NAD(P)-dependent oxidoreductase [Bacteriovoracia bacterium]
MDGSKTKKKIAIITGASSGLGAEFALQIEASFYLDEVWLIARRQEPMRDLARRFQKSKAVLISYDLSNRNDLVNFEKKLEAEQPQIEILVNNAGYGKIGPVAELGMNEQMQMIDVNVYALTYLTKASIPFMVAGSKILQVASSIGYCPAPFFAVYAATKAYVVSFSEALGHELKPKGIQVLAVCPGPVATEFFDEAVKNDYLKKKNTPAKPFNEMVRASAHQVVEKALADLGKRRHRSIFGWQIQLFVFFLPFVPQALLFRALEKRNQT